MRRVKKTAAVMLAILFPLLFSGCWDYREVESLTLVAGIAVDRGQNGNKYHLTFECLQMTGGEKASTAEPWIVETEGDTIFEAERKALKVSQKRLYFNPCRVIVLSGDFSREGIKPILDWFLRDAEPRITMDFLVSREKTASEILKQKPSPGQMTSYQISDMISGSAGFSGEVARTRLYEINNTLNSEGVSLVLPGISVSGGTGDANLKLTGTAVFKEDKMIGWLTDKQTQYLNFVLDRITGGLIITSDSPEDEKMSVEILRSSTKVEPCVENGFVTMKIDVAVKAALGERESDSEVPGEEPIGKAEKDAERTLENGMGDLISQVQEKYDSDIFGFGGIICREDPDKWENLKSTWDKGFRNLKYETHAEVVIWNTALVQNEKGGG